MPDESPGASRAYRRWLALLALLAVAGLLALTAVAQAGRRQVGAAARELAGRYAGARLTGDDALVRDPDGRTRPLVQGDGVVVIIATSCPHCHRTLAALAAAGPAPERLVVVALDGARAGARLLDSLGLAVPVVEPADRDRFLETLHVTGTPLLLHVRADASVADALLGAPSAGELRAWRARALGR